MIWKLDKLEDRMHWAKQINHLGGLGSEVINRIIEKNI